MAARNALVLIGGVPAEMPAGDTLNGTSGGGGGANGTATLDFGAFPGTNEASITFASAGIAAGSRVTAAIMGGDTTSDHTASDHRYAAALIGLSCAATAGVGGTIYARSSEKLQGTFAVRWSWS
ncbi:hypothetical protein [Novosphingobium sp.]|uniref:hypothetical protein n=1 Tax=Novosphingobium sp. TaxID=1874826 RepID=UPI00286D8CD6|nr:hypothetical protein [Novosphingobium sp.]